jgi:hypothetical protein
MLYKVTYLLNNSYCEAQPSDNECQREQLVEANSKAEAVMNLHYDRGMIRVNSIKNGGGKSLPDIWSVEKV